MKNSTRYRNATKAFGLFLFMVIITISSFAQPSDDDDNGFGGDADTAVPIDGGLSLLLAAGAGYVAKKAHDSRKKKAESDKQVP